MRKILIVAVLTIVPLFVEAQNAPVRRNNQGTHNSSNTNQHRRNRNGANNNSDQSQQQINDVSIIATPQESSLCPDGNHPHMIDLGLPSGTKWACCNVGAQRPGEYGEYYSWGETQNKRDYSWGTYQWCRGYYISLTKYNFKSNCGSVDNKTQLDINDDTARSNWGGLWHMPTNADCQELIDGTNSTWAIVNGIYGRCFTSKTNDCSIFLPAAGYRSFTSLEYCDFYGYYWSASLNESEPCYALRLSLGRGIYGHIDDGNRVCGLSVRPVINATAQLAPVQPSSPATPSFCPDENHPHMIDLGLPSGTKWACCNVGAFKPENYGDIFAWGETSTKSSYQWANYHWFNNEGRRSKITKYCTKSSFGSKDKITQLELNDDAAHVNMGGSWRMPTEMECRELNDGTNSSWTTINGINGRLFTSKSNGLSIFLPAEGWVLGDVDKPFQFLESGYFWSSSLDESTPSNARFLYFDSNRVFMSSRDREGGQSIRPVSGD